MYKTQSDKNLAMIEQAEEMKDEYREKWHVYKELHDEMKRTLTDLSHHYSEHMVIDCDGCTAANKRAQSTLAQFKQIPEAKDQTIIVQDMKKIV